MINASNPRNKSPNITQTIIMIVEGELFSPPTVTENDITLKISKKFIVIEWYKFFFTGNLNYFLKNKTQLTFTYSKSTMKTLEKDVKYVQS